MKVLKLLATGLLGSLFCLLLTSTAHAGPVLDAIYKRDAVRCGVSSGVAGFSALGADRDSIDIEAEGLAGRSESET